MKTHADRLSRKTVTCSIGIEESSSKFLGDVVPSAARIFPITACMVVEVWSCTSLEVFFLRVAVA
jgi:hypothetical protein